ncbi:uncharacterized protein VTP21DRAFT_7525 [Calcarisporiella thermophila]|uniref:uncharacterized protein n=1 Tax=Calcarisporiella thermophila TaxID=911321 RepID=UPI003743E234
MLRPAKVFSFLNPLGRLIASRIEEALGKGPPKRVPPHILNFRHLQPLQLDPQKQSRIIHAILEHFPASIKAQPLPSTAQFGIVSRALRGTGTVRPFSPFALQPVPLRTRPMLGLRACGRNFTTMRPFVQPSAFQAPPSVFANLSPKPFSSVLLKMGAGLPDNAQQQRIPTMKPNSGSVSTKTTESSRQWAENLVVPKLIQGHDAIISSRVSSAQCLNEPSPKTVTEQKNIVGHSRVYISFLLEIPPLGGCNLPFNTLRSLDAAFISGIEDYAYLQHRHTLVVISMLKKLLRLGNNVKLRVLDSELRVEFPLALGLEDVRLLLKSLGIDPNNPHFVIEEGRGDGDENGESLDEDMIEIEDFSSGNEEKLDNSPFDSRFSRDKFHVPSPSPELLSSMPSTELLGEEYLSGVHDFLQEVAHLVSSQAFERRP